MSLPILSSCGRDWLLMTSTAHLAARTSWTVSMLSRPQPWSRVWLWWRSTRTPGWEHLIRWETSRLNMKIARFQSYSSSSFQSINVMSVGRNHNVSNPQNSLFYQRSFVVWVSESLHVFIRWRIHCSCLSLIHDTLTPSHYADPSSSRQHTLTVFPSPSS